MMLELLQGRRKFTEIRHLASGHGVPDYRRDPASAAQGSGPARVVSRPAGPRRVMVNRAANALFTLRGYKRACLPRI